MRRPDYGGSGLPCAALMGDRPQDAEIERMVGEARERQEELKAYLNTPQSRNSIKNMLLTRRTVEMLLNIARGEGIEQNDKEVQGDD